ncbi:hypothetical protein KUTeg_002472 [Tegillarca granosa]|uniref:Condensation domain-containing protein n=1 Tax=Tegillarca granosa TaxID=220873 RepID=A0ABQ9FUI2_TEGGR|nr:hypothetical protein KUTeg_002472 [Tegillarca granosa]
MAGTCLKLMDRYKMASDNEEQSRPMGSLETMYHKYHKRGIDIYAQIIHLRMLHPINLQQTREALECLVKRHPLLRMTIKELKSGSSQNFKFEEMDPFILDLREIYADDLEKVLAYELNNPLNCNDGPLWRFTVIYSNNSGRKFLGKLNHNFTFMFKCHHSLADGIYLHQLYSDFIEYVDLIQRGYQIKQQIKELTVLPAIENLIPFMYAPKARDQILATRNTLGQRKDNLKDALSAYNNRFSGEISNFSKKEISTKVVRMSINMNATARFLLSCKYHKVSVSGACIAAACTSMLDLVRSSLSEKVDCISIPVEIMVDLRRYMIDKTLFDSYPGVAAIHIPLDVTMNLDINYQEEKSFWTFAKQISMNIETLISTGKPLEVMAEESRSCDDQNNTGKSPYVICFTNLSSVDKVLKTSLKDRFKIERFPGITKVTIDDMPIFFIGAFTLNKMFNIGVEYCTNYTSENTAAHFSWKLLSHLQHASKLIKQSRPMGPLETMYHKYHKQEMDIFAQIIHLRMLHPINLQQTREALECLVKRHPLLRMTIKEFKSASCQSFEFEEMDPFILDLKEIYADDLEKVLAYELNNPLNCNDGPLWRFTVIYSNHLETKFSDKFNHNFTFMFKFHHSLVDGTYLNQLYSDFIEYIDWIQRGYQIKQQIKELPMFPAIENLIHSIDVPQASEEIVAIRNTLGKKETNTIDLLSAYNNQFAKEISNLAKKDMSTKVVRMSADNNETTQFFLSCKYHKVSVSGACIAAACTSMLYLIRSVEIMVSLRRYMIDKTLSDSYPGVAAIHVPLDVIMNLSHNYQEEHCFWTLAKQISVNIETLISTGKPSEVMAEESRSWDNQKNTGKSPYVICFTNLSSIDHILKNSLKDRFRIERFPGTTKVTIDDMPIFFIGTFTLNKMFNILIEYCTSYTSDNTAAQFSGIFC